MNKAGPNHGRAPRKPSPTPLQVSTAMGNLAQWVMLLIQSLALALDSPALTPAQRETLSRELAEIRLLAELIETMAHALGGAPPSPPPQARRRRPSPATRSPAPRPVQMRATNSPSPVRRFRPASITHPEPLGHPEEPW